MERSTTPAQHLRRREQGVTVSDRWKPSDALAGDEQTGGGASAFPNAGGPALELSRCYERLDSIFELTESVCQLRDAGRIEQAVFARFGRAVDADGLLLEREGRLEVIAPWTRTRIPEKTLESLRRSLDSAIATIRSTGRTCTVDLTHDAPGSADGMYVLLGSLWRKDGQPAVIAGLRRADRPPFDGGDRLAAETILVYGGHILRNAQLVEDVQRGALETVGALANAIEARDPYTSGHSARVGWLARMVGRALDLNSRELQLLEWAGILHDVGKLGISDQILHKRGPLTAEEFDEIKKHPQRSYEVIRPVSTLAPVLDAVLYHHENYDGGGYPTGLAGDRIPLAARILRIVDVFDALTSARSYRERMTIDAALKLIARDAGRVTDPHLTYLFLGAIRRYLREHVGDFRVRFAHLSDDDDLADGAFEAGARCGPEPLACALEGR